jgi:tyramine---L-glutamate ligase
MRLFIYELTCAGGLGANVPRSLRHEGAAMLAAVVEDFERVPGINVLTLLRDDCSRSIGRQVRWTAPAEEPQAFRDLASQSDAALIIAPEFDDLLAQRTAWAIAAGCRMLGSGPDGIRRTQNKFRLARWLSRHHIPTPATRCLSATTASADAFPCVIKPRDGAGAQATFLVRHADDWAAAHRQALAEWPSAELVLQPYCRGQAASVTFFVGNGQVVPTPGATQRQSNDGRLRYLGGSAPLARRAVESVPGLFGYVGVDLILGDAADGTGDVVVEINPRLTTSYIGLRQLTRTNLAEIWLHLFRGETVFDLEWHDDRVIEFDCEGRISLAVSRSV